MSSSPSGWLVCGVLGGGFEAGFLPVCSGAAGGGLMGSLVLFWRAVGAGMMGDDGEE